MSVIDWVRAYEKSPVGEYISSLDTIWVIIFQIIHVFSILTLLTAVIVYALYVWGGISLWVGARQEAQALTSTELILLKAAQWGLVGAVVSGVALFLTSAVHYATNQAFPIKLILIALTVVLQFGFFRTWRVRASRAGHTELQVSQVGDGVISWQLPKPRFAWSVRLWALGFVVLWFLVGFAGRAIGFV